MTREEAIKILRREIECLSHTKCEDCILEAGCNPIKTTPYDSEYIEAYEIAIKALEQEPCEDVIDRAEAMTEIMMFAGNVKSDEEDIYIKVSDTVQLLRELPSITPQPKTGHWIDDEFGSKCSCCGIHIDKYMKFNYCPVCGTRMVEPQESEG